MKPIDYYLLVEWNGLWTLYNPCIPFKSAAAALTEAMTRGLLLFRIEAF